MKSRLTWTMGMLLLGAVALTSAGCDDDDKPPATGDGGTDAVVPGTDAASDGPATTDTPVATDTMTTPDVPPGGGDTAPDAQVPVAQKVTLGPAGGSIVFHGGRFTLILPRGALSRPTEVTVSVDPAAPPGALGTAYLVTPEQEPLARPATALIKYSAAEIGSAKANELRIGRFAEAHWIDLDFTKVDVAAARQTIQAELPKFGTVALIAGVCELCTSTCQADTPCMIENQAGRCQLFGNGCAKCVPTCDADGDGFCSNSARPDPNDLDINVAPDVVEICGNNYDDNGNNHTDEGCTACTADGDCRSGNEACTGGFCNVCQGGCEPAACRFGFTEPSIENPLGTPGVPGQCFNYGVGCSRCVPTCDADGDGYCPAAEPGNNQMGNDCNDANRDAYPSAPEVCGNGVDDDCNGYVDDKCDACINNSACPRAGFACVSGACEGCQTTCTVGEACNLTVGPGEMAPEGKCEAYGNACSKCVPKCDGDGDGYCPGNTGNAAIPGNDCNDNDETVFPGALVEVCDNGEDDNCNDSQNEGCEACAKDDDCKNGLACVAGLCELCNSGCDPTACRFGQLEGMPNSGVLGQCIDYGKNLACKKCVPACDKDGDGYCPGPTVMGQEGGDCQDDNVNANPFSKEVCGNTLDDDCDGLIDEECASCNTGLMCSPLETCSTKL